MLVSRAERYSIERRPDDSALLMRQGRYGVRVALSCAGVLFLTWWVGPYGPHTISAFAAGPDLCYWLWSGFFTFCVLLSVLAAPFDKENVTLTDTEIVAETMVYWRRSIRRMPRARPLGIWTETIVSDAGRMFPYRVHFLDASGRLRRLRPAPVVAQRRATAGGVAFGPDAGRQGSAAGVVAILYGAVGFDRAGITLSVSRIDEGFAEASGAPGVEVNAAESMSGSWKLAVTSTRVPRGSAIGVSNQ